jgi:zinc transporter ZupT
VLKCQAWRNKSRETVPLLGWIIMFTAVGGIASAAFAGLFLLLPERTGLRMLPHFVSFATGALIGAALLGLLPEAMESVGPGGAHSIGIAMVVGLGVFFIIEKLVLWRHAHSHEHQDPTARDVVAHGVTDALARDDGDATAAIVRPDADRAGSANTAASADRAGSASKAGSADRAGGENQAAGAVRAHSVSEHAAMQVVGAAPGHAAVAFAGDLGGHTEVRGARLHNHGGHNAGEPVHGRPGDGAYGRAHSPTHEHGHAHDHSRDGAAGVLVLIGDSIHNALDGILIAAAFLTSVPLGLVTTLAVAAHEIPHRVGDFALLLHAGMSRSRAMFLNMATGLASVLGGIVAYFGLSKAQDALPYALALASAGFLYIAVAGLIPGLHRRADPQTSLAQVLLMGLGVGVIAVAESLTH